MIFVSYAREDGAAARRLVQELAADGQPCLIDPALPHGDAFWREQLAQRLAACRLMVRLESPHAAASPWVQQERRGFAGIGPTIGVDAGGDSTAAARIAAAWRRASGDTFRESAGAAPESEQAVYDRAALMARAEAWLDAWLQRPRPRAQAAFDGPRAWLADGRIVLVQTPVAPGLPGSCAGIYLATQPLSNALYREFVEANAEVAPPPTWSRPAFAAHDLPVTGITWFEAAACAAWFGASLPDEADWAWAAGNGAARAPYATADGTLAPALAHAGVAFAQGAPRAATDHPPNPAGFHGLCGNTWDWTTSAWGTHRAIRGGGWMDDATFCRVDARYRNAPIDRDACVGLRLALVRPDPASTGDAR